MARTTATPSRPYKTPCDQTMQKCPECGGLECLCRPRFFAGQLLTEQDLNRLDHYIVAKNKLHNRYLFGWGVVCGLEVVCHPCNMVAVRPGYALSPCGEDIIVCRETTVDVCSLINACRKPQQDPCAPIDAGQADPCNDTIENWVLAIRYQETPTRGVTPLKGSSGSACCSRCTCGGSSGCGCGGSTGKSGGCGCGGGNGSTSSTSTSSSGGCSCSTKTARQAPPQCEPTVVCEGYTFEVCQMQPRIRQVDFGPLDAAWSCCLTLWASFITTPPLNQSLATAKAWCCSLKNALADLFASHPGHNCTLAEQIGTLCGDPDPKTDPNAYVTAIAGKATALLGSFWKDCFCSAVLPPCPSPVDDDRIYLATITIRRKDCKILQICNWDQRNLVLTFPTLSYWLSPLQLGRTFRDAISTICCPPLDQKVLNPLAAGKINLKAAEEFRRAQRPANADDYSTDLGAIFAGAMSNQDRTVTPEAIAAAAFGATSDGTQPLLTPEEMANPGEAVFIYNLVRPVLSGGIAAGLNVREASSGTTQAAPSGAAPAGTTDNAVLRDEISSLRATLAEQQKDIDALNAKLNQG